MKRHDFSLFILLRISNYLFFLFDFNIHYDTAIAKSTLRRTIFIIQCFIRTAEFNELEQFIRSLFRIFSKGKKEQKNKNEGNSDENKIVTNVENYTCSTTMDTSHSHILKLNLKYINAIRQITL